MQSETYHSTTDHWNYTITWPTPLLLKIHSTEKMSPFIHYWFVFRGQRYGVLVKGDMYAQANCLVRFSSNCQRSFYFDNSYCDCKWQLEHAKSLIHERGVGMIVFAHDQHGKGVGIENHRKIYTEGLLRDRELVVDAYEKLGFREDYREYDDFISILQHFWLSSITLMSNSPKRKALLEKAGIAVTLLSTEEPIRPELKQEYRSKKQKLSHLLHVSDQELV